MNLTKLMALAIVSAAAVPFANATPVNVNFSSFAGSTPTNLNGNPYTQNGFTVSYVSSTGGANSQQVLNPNQGDNAPGLTVVDQPGGTSPNFTTATNVFALAPSTFGSLFGLNNFSLGAITASSQITVTGYTGSSLNTSSSTQVYSYTFTEAPQVAVNGVCPTGSTMGYRKDGTTATGVCYQTINLPSADEGNVNFVTISSASLAGANNTNFPVDYFDNFNLTPTPEPSALMLLGTGLAGVGAIVRRRKHSNVA